MSGKLWYVSVSGDARGPFTESELATRLRNGDIPLTAHVWNDSMASWILLTDSNIPLPTLIDSENVASQYRISIPRLLFHSLLAHVSLSLFFSGVETFRALSMTDPAWVGLVLVAFGMYVGIILFVAAIGAFQICIIYAMFSPLLSRYSLQLPSARSWLLVASAFGGNAIAYIELSWIAYLFEVVKHFIPASFLSCAMTAVYLLSCLSCHSGFRCITTTSRSSVGERLSNLAAILFALALIIILATIVFGSVFYGYGSPTDPALGAPYRHRGVLASEHETLIQQAMFRDAISRFCNGNTDSVKIEIHGSVQTSIQTLREARYEVDSSSFSWAPEILDDSISDSPFSGLIWAQSDMDVRVYPRNTRDTYISGSIQFINKLEASGTPNGISYRWFGDGRYPRTMTLYLWAVHRDSDGSN